MPRNFNFIHECGIYELVRIYHSFESISEPILI